MPGTGFQTVRQSLHLSIDPSPYDAMAALQLSPDSSPSSSSARASEGTAGTSPSSGGSSDGFLHSALCMYDFESDDPCHLPFRKNEILDIVKQEESGWWAAMRRGGNVIGWIPHAFVRPLSEDMADKLRSVREELRVYEYEAEQLYNQAPISRYELEPASEYKQYNDDYPSSAKSPVDVRKPYPPPSPVTPMPQPPQASISAPINKPTPPTPTEQPAAVSSRDRAGSEPGYYLGNPRNARALSRLDTLQEYMSRRDNNSPEIITTGSPDASSRRAEKIARITGSGDAVNFHNALNSPWYLRPKYADQLLVDSDGQVRMGTIPALLEKLTSDILSKDPLKTAQENLFREIFLTTFRTFMEPDQLFDMLRDIYRMEPPNGLTDSEFEDWKEKCQVPTQRLVLTVYTMWLEDHRLLEEEPSIAQRLMSFLSLIKAATPAPQAITAKLIMQSIERLTFANPSDAINVPARRRKRSRAHKGELLRMDPADIAEQLCLIEYALYKKITPQECIAYAKVQSGKAVSNLNAFCSTHDKVAAWVTASVLSNDALGRRADTVDFWIKVAEKCRNLCNFASMSAIINALSSTVVTRLHLTWAHVGRKGNLDALLKFNDPSGGFSGYRSLQSIDGPCVPFIGMYLTDIVHIQDQFSDEAEGKISFIKRQRWYEAANLILRFQNKPYVIAESDSIRTLIHGHLSAHHAREQVTKFWSRSQEVQQSELAHADIRRGLEKAGF